MGKRNLEEAARISNIPIKVKWDPFFLNPSTPPEGIDLRQYLESKYGQAAIMRFSAADNPLDTAGRRVGITFNKNRRIVNTLSCHRIMEWCYETKPDFADSLMEIFFHAYFVEAKDISNKETLLDICDQSGLDRVQVAAMLESGI